MFSALLVGLFAYLCGSIPFAYLIGKGIGGIDIRTVGSGNVGATNIGRTMGMRWGILVLVLDAIKGLVPVGLFPYLFVDSTDPQFIHLKVIAAVGAIVGHMCPVWLGFRGGKGVATALGVVLVLSPYASLGALVAFLVAFAWKRIVSIASILAVIVFSITHFCLMGQAAFSDIYWSLSLFAIAAPLLIIWRHRSNIGRLIRGEEKAFVSGRRNAELDTQPETEEPEQN
ncbi:MAG: glycerol-3-phosphate 1-O-acyltransferase PlsY [Planctomycetaceae bacterium]|nr:glycerol-3-phosphate 1-O-acyltransferase PlsY [Planctomycetaceae bacterium]